MPLILTALYHAAAMLWEILWALVLGFAISAVLQIFVSKETMVGAFGRNGLRQVLLAMALGAASSSCSYAAAAATNTVFKKGAAFVPSLAFMIASTNLVVELGMVLWILMGWRFVLAEAVGAFVMVAIVWAIFAVRPPLKLIEAARTHQEAGEEEGCCHHHHRESRGKSKLIQVADAFFMDWSMLWKEILLGVLIAGFLMALVPAGAWQALFISHGSYPVRLAENALLGPLVAMASFVCSVGNIPLASVLWSSGATFGGVVAFLYGDLIVLPLIVAYRKYYGWPAAAYITLVLYAAMVLAGLVVDLVFTGLRLVPSGGRGASAMAEAGFSWNYTTWLDLLAAVVGLGLLSLHFQGVAPGEPDSHLDHDHASDSADHVHDH